MYNLVEKLRKWKDSKKLVNICFVDNHGLASSVYYSQKFEEYLNNRGLEMKINFTGFDNEIESTIIGFITERFKIKRADAIVCTLRKNSQMKSILSSLNTKAPIYFIEDLIDKRGKWDTGYYLLSKVNVKN